jgi:trk system potassium uptake protein
MKVIIVGAGEVGFHLAQRLSHENQDVVLIDSDPDRIERAQDHLDVETILGNGASLPVLERAGISGARILLAVTSSDEVNLITCLAANRLGVKHTVARISNPEYHGSGTVLSREALGITLMINPERECARDIFNLLLSAGATDVADFAQGKVQLVGVRVREGAKVAGRSLIDLRREMRQFHFVVAAIVRDERTIIPVGSSVIEEGDQIFVLSPAEEVWGIPPLAGYPDFKLRRVMIAGGTREGLYLAQMLEQHRIECTILEPDRARCLQLAEALPRSLVLEADPTDAELLEGEGISEIDGFVAATGDDQRNFLTSLLARSAGAQKIITLVEKFEHLPLVPRIGLDVGVSPRMSAVNAILRYVRGGRVTSVATFKGTDAEAIEFRAEAGMRITEAALRDLGLPEGALVGAIVRGGKVLPPSGAQRVQAGDDVIVFTLPEALHRIESYFQ